MRKVADMLKPRHYFYASDGTILKTVNDLFSFLSNTDDAVFYSHVDGKKNDFVNWVRDTLLFPELAINLLRCTNINDSKKALLEFFEAYYDRPYEISEDRGFKSIDGYTVLTTHELFYYLNDCDDSAYAHHTQSGRNDFANWIRSVLKYDELADRIAKCSSRQDAVNTIKDFVMNSQNYRHGAGAYLDYIEATRKTAGLQGKTPVGVNKPNLTDASPKDGHTKDGDIKGANLTDKKPGMERLVIDPDLIKKKDDYDDKAPFRQFTDEELDRFTKFSKPEKVDTNDEKADYLKSALQELNNMVKELRKMEKDPLVPELLLRVIASKIDYFSLSKNSDDYERIINGLKDIQKEIEYCAHHTYTNFAQELMKDMELQGIIMKKSD